ncbi:MAG: alpha-L-rhamnosidase C-terminal domain-containing protein [Phycisphaerae bacterium]
MYHSDTPSTGSFSCSHAKLNQLQHNIVWGQRGNFVEVPTDCPQRDERLGWMGDAQVFSRTAAFNMDVAAFFNRWLLDVSDAQLPDGAYTDVVPDVLTNRKLDSWGSGAPAWGDAGIICPWMVYLAYGDRRILERQYDSICCYIAYLDRRCINGVHPDFGYGDWLAINSETNKQLIGTAYSAYSISLMQKIAGLLGKQEDQQRFARLFEKIKTAFNREFVTPAGRLVNPSQTAAVMALYFQLVDEPVRSCVANWLTADITSRGVLTTGFVGCHLILPVLSQLGRDDLAWQMLTNEKFPSWLFSVNQGATTIWERWDGWTPEKGFQDAGMNSFNHYAYGSCGQWMYARIGGIELDETEPGYRHIIVDPVLARGLTWGQASLETLYGQVNVAWKLAGENFSIKLTIPPNTHATLRLPGKYTAGDAEASMLRGENAGRTTVELPAGTYKLTSVLLVSTK